MMNFYINIFADAKILTDPKYCCRCVFANCSTSKDLAGSISMIVVFSNPPEGFVTKSTCSSVTINAVPSLGTPIFRKIRYDVALTVNLVQLSN